jgi:hypothetical protein
MNSPARPGLRLAALLATLACDGGLQPVLEPTACPPGHVGICGTVRFRGAVPDSTQAVYVIAYDTFPDSRDDLFKLRPPIVRLEPLPLGDTTAFFAVPLDPGRYEWVLAAWVRDGFTPLNADTHLFEAGYYRDPADTARAGVVIVPGGGRADSIDFVVDYTNMRPVSFWFPPASPPAREARR